MLLLFLLVYDRLFVSWPLLFTHASRVMQCEPAASPQASAHHVTIAPSAINASNNHRRKQSLRARKTCPGSYHGVHGSYIYVEWTTSLWCHVLRHSHTQEGRPTNFCSLSWLLYAWFNHTMRSMGCPRLYAHRTQIRTGSHSRICNCHAK